VIITLDTKKLVAGLINLGKQLGIYVGGSPVMAILIIDRKVVMSDITVKDTDPDTYNAATEFKDADGNVTTADDVPVWASSDPSIATVVAADDGLSATVTKTNTIGATVISVDSMNASGVDVHAQATLTVTPGDEVSGDVTLTPAAPVV
jgi:hypothetical protein